MSHPVFYQVGYKHPSGEVGNYVAVVANLLQYLRAKNYQNTMRFDKVTAKTERVQYFCPTVYTIITKYLHPRYATGQLQQASFPIFSFSFFLLHFGFPFFRFPFFRFPSVVDPLATSLCAFTRYVLDRSIGVFMLTYKTYHTRILFFDRYERTLTYRYSILAYTYRRAVLAHTPNAVRSTR